MTPMLTAEQVEALPERAREIVEYRKSGLSLNHIQGCPLDCAYCIRHTYGLWDQRQPRALKPDAEAVERLVSHRYFEPHLTPVQLFNRATDPFLPAVKPHTFAVLLWLDRLRNIKLTLLFTYSGIDDKRIEPFPSQVAAESLRLASSLQPHRYRTVLYWRPLVPGLNDSDEQLDAAYALSRHADATVYTGLFYRDQIAANLNASTGHAAATLARRTQSPTTRADAQHRLGQAIDQFDAAQARPAALCMAQLATLHLEAGELDQGTHWARRVLDTAGDIRSHRLTEHLAMMKTAADRHTDEVMVKQLLADLAEVAQ